MKLKDYAFIVLGPEYDSAKDTAVLASPIFKTTVTGVGSIEEACLAAKRVVQGGAQLIELCGGFDEAAMSRVIEAIDGSVPVGRVHFTGDEKEKLEAFLGE